MAGFRLPRPGLVEKGVDLGFKDIHVAVHVRGADLKIVILLATHPVFLPGQAIDLVDLAAHLVESLAGCFNLLGTDAEMGGQFVDFMG